MRPTSLFLAIIGIGKSRHKGFGGTVVHPLASLEELGRVALVIATDVGELQAEAGRVDGIPVQHADLAPIVLAELEHRHGLVRDLFRDRGI